MFCVAYWNIYAKKGYESEHVNTIIHMQHKKAFSQCIAFDFVT